jgi:hypothetical protein
MIDLQLLKDAAQKQANRFDLFVGISPENLLHIISCLESAVEALEKLVTPINVFHTVHPRCYCNACTGKEALDAIKEKVEI